MSHSLRLGELIDIRSGKSRPKNIGAYPVYGGNGIFGSAPIPNIDSPTIIIGRVGAYCGSVYLEKSPFWLSDNALGITPHSNLDLRYLYYLLQTLDLNSRSVGGAQPLLTQKIINDIVISVPELDVQKKTSHFLSAIDEKIELNQRMTATFEQICIARFRQDFISNPEATRWKIGTLYSVSSYIGRGISPKYDEEGEFLTINQRCIRGKRLDVTNARRQSKAFGSEKMLMSGDVLINSTGVGTLGRVAQVDDPPSNCTFDSHVTLVRPKSDINVYFFGELVRELEPIFETMGRGTTGQTELSRTAVGEVTFKLPPLDAMNDFGELITPFRRQMVANELQNQHLVELRDALLPRLMSGEIAL